MVIRCIAIIIILINVGWAQIARVAEPIGQDATGVVLGCSGFALAVAALGLRAQPRWIWIIISLGGLAQVIEEALPPPEAGSEWEYVGPEFWLASRAVMFLAAFAGFVLTFSKQEE